MYHAGYNSAAVADMNGDGIADVIISGESPNGTGIGVCAAFTAVIHTTINPAPILAVFGIKSRTATTVSNAPDPSRNTG